MRFAWATYEDRVDPSRVEDTRLAAAVEAALSETMPLDDALLAPPLAVVVVGDALSAYHGAIDVGYPSRARPTVQARVAVALAHMVSMHAQTGTREQRRRDGREP